MLYLIVARKISPLLVITTQPHEELILYVLLLLLTSFQPPAKFPFQMFPLFSYCKTDHGAREDKSVTDISGENPHTWIILT